MKRNRLTFLIIMITLLTCIAISLSSFAAPPAPSTSPATAPAKAPTVTPAKTPAAITPAPTPAKTIAPAPSPIKKTVVTPTAKPTEKVTLPTSIKRDPFTDKDAGAPKVPVVKPKKTPAPATTEKPKKAPTPVTIKKEKEIKVVTVPFTYVGYIVKGGRIFALLVGGDKKSYVVRSGSVIVIQKEGEATEKEVYQIASVSSTKVIVRVMADYVTLPHPRFKKLFKATQPITKSTQPTQVKKPQDRAKDLKKSPETK